MRDQIIAMLSSSESDTSSAIVTSSVEKALISLLSDEDTLTEIAWTPSGMFRLVSNMKDAKKTYQEALSLVDMGVIQTSKVFQFDRLAYQKSDLAYIKSPHKVFEYLIGVDEVVSKTDLFLHQWYACICLLDHDIMQRYLRSNKSKYEKAYIIALLSMSPIDVLANYALTTKAKADILSCITL